MQIMGQICFNAFNTSVLNCNPFCKRAYYFETLSLVKSTFSHTESLNGCQQFLCLLDTATLLNLVPICCPSLPGQQCFINNAAQNALYEHVAAFSYVLQSRI